MKAMLGFGKKEKDEEIPEEDIKVRDLKPKSRARRKEPVKPWGRGERVLVLVVLGLTVAVSAIFNFMARNGLGLKLANLGQLTKLTLPSLGQTFVFESSKNRVEGASTSNTPAASFRNMTNNLTGTYGLYVVRLDNSFSYGLNENMSYTAASLIKLPAVMALYKEAEAGNINLEDTHAIQWWEKAAGNGSLVGLPAGTAVSYRDIAKEMIIQSDNTAFNIVVNLLGQRKIQEFINAEGMTMTSVADNTASPTDIANLLEKLVNNKVLSKQDSTEIMSYLKETDFSSWLVAGIPKNIEVAHKYGDEIGTVNDAGIVYTDRPYIVVIMSKNVDEAEANNIFPQLSKAIYDFEEK